MPAKPKSGKALSITVIVEDKAWAKQKLALRLMRRAAILAGESGTPRSRPAGFTILLANDARLKALNTDFRGQAKPTNVLSFPAADPLYLGDIAIAYGMVAREARAAGKRFSAHAAHLAAHGVLHLLGHDHQKKAEAKRMEALERRILARLGLADPYAATGKAA